MIKQAVWIILPVLVLFQGCQTGSKSKTTDRPVDLFETREPVKRYGSDSEIKAAGTYIYIPTFTVDGAGNVYVADSARSTVDKYDNTGRLLFTMGGINHESFKYREWIEVFDTDKNGNLIAYSNPGRRFLRFSNDGKDLQVIMPDIQLIRRRIIDLKIDPAGQIYLLTYTETEGCQLIAYNLETRQVLVLHTDNKRIQPLFKLLPPDFALDSEGNCYITDTIDYRVYKYSPGHRLIRTFTKDAAQIKIEESDLNIRVRPGITRKLSNYDIVLKKLEGASGNFPYVIGIDIDGDRIYLWTAEQDTRKRFLVDIYDREFKYVGRAAGYNEIGENRVIIKEGMVYMPNIGEGDEEFKREIGRFDLVNTPYRIDLFMISRSI
jgi:hypothetical protein